MVAAYKPGETMYAGKPQSGARLAGGGGVELNVVAPAITPTLSAELLANGSMESGSPPSSWGAFNSAALTSQTDERTGGSGTKSLQVARNGNNAAYAGQVEAVTTDLWFYMTCWQKNIDASGGLQAKFQDGSAFVILCGGPNYQTGTSWAQVHGTGKSTQTTNGVARLYIEAVTNAQSARFDDVSLKSITFSSMLSLAGTRTTVPGIYQCTPRAVIGTHVGLVIRYTDDNNFVMALLDRGQEKVSLVKRVSGTYSNVVSPLAITYAEDAPLRVTINADGTTYTLYYNGAQVGSPTTVSDTLGYGVYGFSAYAGNEVGLVTTSPFDYAFFPVGDSKTVAASASGRGYQSYLEAYLKTSTTHLWVQHPPQYATAGYTVAAMLTYVNANLSSLSSADAPDYILINLGANDVKNSTFAGLTEAGLKADYLDLLDQFHAKWPNAQMYLMRVWRSSADADLSNLTAFNGWVDDIIAARDFVYAGPDERVFLEGGDNGATYTVDGTHPNAAGYALTATQWQTAMGL